MRKILLFSAAAGLLLPSVSRAALIPVIVSGFNQDVVVDAGAPQGSNVQGFITASMDDGTAKAGGTWYQTGYNTGAPTTGLPSSTVVNSLTGDGTFFLAPANTPNALLLNDASPGGTLTNAGVASYSQLAIFSATGNGNGTINYTINHFNGASPETGTFTSPDWFGNSPIAYVTAGRVNNTATGTTDAVGSPTDLNANPRVYEQLVTVTNPSPVTSISFTRATGGGNTAILAVSGTLIPEPGSLALAAIGGLGLLARRRRHA
jgi:hypothetical protein